MENRRPFKARCTSRIPTRARLAAPPDQIAESNAMSAGVLDFQVNVVISNSITQADLHSLAVALVRICTTIEKKAH